MTRTWNWDFVWEVLPELLLSLGPTFLITVLGFGLALVLGLLLGWARLDRARALRLPATALADVVRSTPFLVQLFVVFYALPRIGVTFDPFTAGIVTLGIYYSAYVSDIFRSSFLAIPTPLIESSAVLGFDNRHTWRRVILPLGFRAAFPGLVSYLIMSFKETALLVAIGVPVVLGKAQSIGYFNLRYLEVYTIAGLLYLVITYPAAWLLRKLEVRAIFD